MNKHPLSLLLLAALSAAALAQPSDGPAVSSVQWANASCAGGVKFTLLGDVVADPWQPGGRVGGGPRSATTYRASFAPTPPLAALQQTIQIKAGDSAAAVLVGDFRQVKLPAGQSGTPPGHTRMDDGSFLRADVLTIPVAKQKPPEHPVYFLNGSPSNPVKVELAGGPTFDLKYGEPALFKAVPEDAHRFKVTAKGLAEEMGFSLDPLYRGAIIAFYTTPEGGTKFVFVKLQSLESLREMVRQAAALGQ